MPQLIVSITQNNQTSQHHCNVFQSLMNFKAFKMTSGIVYTLTHTVTDHIYWPQNVMPECTISTTTAKHRGVKSETTKQMPDVLQRNANHHISGGKLRKFCTPFDIYWCVYHCAQMAGSQKCCHICHIQVMKTKFCYCWCVVPMRNFWHFLTFSLSLLLYPLF